MLCTEVTTYVALGANLGDAQTALLRAMDDMAKLPGTQVAQKSSLYISAPVHSSGPHYLNAVVELKTRLPAPSLLVELQNLEHHAGRERPYANAPRTLDLDILCYGSATMSSAALTLPHPRMAQRAFVLLPLHEIAPSLVSAQQLQAVAGQDCKIYRKNTDLAQ